jgi:cephalosporin-C deacetylase
MSAIVEARASSKRAGGEIVQSIVRGRAQDHRTSVERPDDFDQFWDTIMADAAAIPLNPMAERVPLRSTPEVETFEIHYDSIDGVRVAGWYCRPAESYLAPPYPGLLLVPGYISEPTLPKSWAKMGYAAVGVAPRGKLRSNRQFNPGYPGLLIRNIVDRETYSYRGFYVDAARAVDFLYSRPEVDRARIGVHGSSQGGALTITTAALRPDAITCGAAGAPYLCGFMDSASLTHSYPYEEINEYLRLYPEREPDVRRTVAYFDGINFAPRITCPMLVYIGLGDDVCPPETGYDLVNAMSCSTEVHAYPRCAHDAGIHWEMPRVEMFLADHLKPAGVVAS